jgi:hypothetical protein
MDRSQQSLVDEVPDSKDPSLSPPLRRPSETPARDPEPIRGRGSGLTPVLKPRKTLVPKMPPFRDIPSEISYHGPFRERITLITIRPNDGISDPMWPKPQPRHLLTHRIFQIDELREGTQLQHSLPIDRVLLLG